jgi:hypothetical protein
MFEIMTSEDVKFVLMEDSPLEPLANAARTVREAYERWVKANDRACAFLIAGMVEVLATKHQNMPTARQIIKSLQGMFTQPSEQMWDEAIRSTMLARMREDSSIREYVLKMMNYFNIAQTHEGAIDERSQVSMILTTLSKSFNQLRSNYKMNKLTFGLTKLLNELIVGKII